jgi:uncharacterized C2H2 Zn-finger protein
MLKYKVFFGDALVVWSGSGGSIGCVTSLVCGGGSGITSLVYGGDSLLACGGGENVVVSLLFLCMFFKCISTTSFLESLTLLQGHWFFHPLTAKWIKVQMAVWYNDLKYIMGNNNASYKSIFISFQIINYSQEVKVQHNCQQFGSHFPEKSLLLQHQRQTMHNNSYDCKISICNKKFGRKDNWDRHVVRHRDKSLFQCSECGTRFSRQDHLDRHIQQYHNQIGRGQKRKDNRANNVPVKWRLAKKDVHNIFDNLSVVSENNIKTFRTTSTKYKVTI